MSFFLSLRFIAGAMAGAIVAAALGVLYAWVIVAPAEYDRGYDAGVAETKAAYEQASREERDRQDAANAEAARNQARRLLTLTMQLRARDAQIEELRHERENDPDAYRLGISPDSMRRTNRF